MTEHHIIDCKWPHGSDEACISACGDSGILKMCLSSHLGASTVLYNLECFDNLKPRRQKDFFEPMIPCKIHHIYDSMITGSVSD